MSDRKDALQFADQCLLVRLSLTLISHFRKRRQPDRRTPSRMVPIPRHDMPMQKQIRNHIPQRPRKRLADFYRGQTRKILTCKYVLTYKVVRDCLRVVCTTPTPLGSKARATLKTCFTRLL